MTSKQYKQEWLRLKHLLKKENNRSSIYLKIWKFQKSILSDEEANLCMAWQLNLPENDPRSWVIKDSDKYFKEVRR